MSLARLLASGKSLMGIKNPEQRYEMRKGVALPKFGSEKNPFAGVGNAEPGKRASREENTADHLSHESEAAELVRERSVPSSNEPSDIFKGASSPRALSSFLRQEARESSSAQVGATPRGPGLSQARAEGATESAPAKPRAVETPQPKISKAVPVASLAPQERATSTRESADVSARMIRGLNPLKWFGSGSRKSSADGQGRRPVQGELSLENVKVVRNDLNDADVEVVPSRVVSKPKASAATPGAEALKAAGNAEVAEPRLI